MANRRITQFPPVQPGQIVDQDLVTTVSVFEADPSLRNKKLTFSGLRTYLDQYYVNVDEIDPILVPNAIVSGYLIVSGATRLANTLNVASGAAFAQNVNITGDLGVSGAANIAGNINTDQIDCTFVTTDGLEVQGNALVTGTISGRQSINIPNGNFSNQILTDSITGVTASFQSGVFQYLSGSIATFDTATIDNLITSGIVVTGELVVTGEIIADNITVTGTISGAVITGDVVNAEFLNVTDGSGNFTYLSGTTITGDLLNVSSGNFEHLVVSQDLTVTGDLRIDDITADVISGNSGFFTNLSGTTITGDTGNFGTINVETLNATELKFSGDQEISGNLTVLDQLFVLSGAQIGEFLTVTGTISGVTVTGASGLFDVIVAAPTISGGDFVGDSATFTGLVVSGNATVTGNLDVQNNLSVRQNLTVTGTAGIGGNTTISGNLAVNGTTELSGDTSISGDLTIVSGDITGDGSTTISGIDGLFVTSGYFESGLIVSGGLDISGDVNLSGNVGIGGTLTVTGQTVIDDNLRVSGTLDVSQTISTLTTVTGTDALFTNGTFTNLTGTTITGTNINGGTINGADGFFDDLTVSGTFIIEDLDLNGNLQVESGIYVGQSGVISGVLIAGSGATISGDVLVSGSGLFASGVTALDNQILAPFGTVGAPGFAYNGDPTMGIMNDGGNAMTHSLNGASGMTLSSGTDPNGDPIAVLTIWAL